MNRAERKARDQRIVKLFRSGLSAKGVAEMVGLSERWARQVFARDVSGLQSAHRGAESTLRIERRGHKDSEQRALAGRIKKLYLSGLPVREVAKRVGQTSGWVRQAIKTNAPEIMRPVGKVPKHDYKQIVALYRSGLNLREIAKQVGVTPQRVWQVIDKDAPEIMRPTAPIPKYDARRLVELYRSGLSFREIAEQVGVSPRRVHQVIKRDAPEIMRPRGSRKKPRGSGGAP